MDPSYLGRPMQAPTAKRPRGRGVPRVLLLVIGLIVAIIAGSLMLFASSDSSGTLQQRLSVRQQTTLAIIADGQKNISDGSLSKLNSELSVVMGSDNAAIQSALTAAGMKKVEPTIKTDESDSATFEQLRLAKLNGQYDATYRRVLVQKLESLRGLLTELYEATKNKKLKSSLATEHEHLGVYLTSLEASVE